MLPGEVHPVRNSSPAIAGLETERGIPPPGIIIKPDSAAASGSASGSESLWLGERASLRGMSPCGAEPEPEAAFRIWNGQLFYGCHCISISQA